VVEETPLHLAYAIDIEEKAIELRKRQIKASKERIKLLKKGMDINGVWKQFPPVKSKTQFNQQIYLKLKEQWRQK